MKIRIFVNMKTVLSNCYKSFKTPCVFSLCSDVCSHWDKKTDIEKVNKWVRNAKCVCGFHKDVSIMLSLWEEVVRSWLMQCDSLLSLVVGFESRG
jgi:hypothetical protein